MRDSSFATEIKRYADIATLPIKWYFVYTIGLELVSSDSILSGVFPDMPELTRGCSAAGLSRTSVGVGF